MPQGSTASRLGQRAKLVPSEDWLAAICAGTPPFERLRDPAFQVEGDAASTGAASRWVDVLRGAFPELGPELWAVMGLDQDTLARAFGRARVVADEPLPRWAGCLIDAVDALPRHSMGAAVNEDSTEIASRAFLEAGAKLLGWDRLRHRYPFVDSRVLPNLARQLATRVVLSCGATLELENTTRTEPVWDFGRGAWLERLCGFTGLNFVVGTAVRQWRQNALEMLSRLGQDLELLQRTLLRDSAPGPLVAVEGDLGDRHNDGRSVAVLTFASGARLVYKPKDLRCAEKFLDLLALVNARSPSITLPTQRIVRRGKYSWEQYVDQRQATTELEAARFFRRFGMLLRVLQLVEGRDFWVDNLLVDGDRPIFVDLECILHPRLEGVGFEVAMAGLEPGLYQESVLPTAAVTQRMEVPGFGKQDLGALSGCGPRALPLGMWNGYRDRRNGNIWLRGGRLFWEPVVAWPQPAGRPADPADYFGELEAGYREAHALLRRCARDLLGVGGPLAGIGNVPVRALMRSTWEYLVLLRASLEPSALLDGNARELALVNVLSTAHPWGCEEDVGRRLTIARSELDAIRSLDIPEFYSIPSGNFVMDTRHVTIPGVFLGSAHDRLKKRLDAIEEFDVDAHVHILRAAVQSIVRPPR